MSKVKRTETPVPISTALVFIEPAKMDAIPFTTSELIAEYSGNSRHAVQVLIDKYKVDFEEFGRVSFEMRPLLTKGGVQEVKVYHLNEEQATLLLTYLKNTPKVRAFKKELVRQFYAMRDELLRRQVERAKLAPVRRAMTDVIRDCIPESPHKAMWYKNYTDLTYRAAFGKSAAQVRQERGAPKDAAAADYLTAEELAAVEKLTKQIGVLVEMRMDYGQIKAIVLGVAARAAS